MESKDILYLITTSVLIITNILTYRYKSGKLKILERVSEKTSSIQTTTIDNLTKYASTISPDEIEKRIDWKTKDLTERHRAELEKITSNYETRLKNALVGNKEEVINETIRELNKELGGWLFSYNELTRIIAYNIRREFMDKSKLERNEFLDKNYPNSKKFLEEILDFQEDTSQITRF